ncbi:MAG: type II secretion system F family protein [Microbacterium sp.]
MARNVTSSAIADTVLRLAVLLQAGVAPARAWAHLAEAGDDAAGRVCAAVARGESLPAAIATAPPSAALSRRARGTGASAPTSGPWRDLSAAWQVAIAVGAPLAESLRSLSVALRDGQEAADDVRVAMAEPAATAKLMGWLPLVAVLLGVALGFDTFGTLLGSPIGIACLALGIALIFGAQRWNAALVKRARAGSGIPGLDAELLAIALSGGVSIDRARRLVHDATGAQPDAATDGVLELSRSAGVPAVELLRASSALARHRARVEGRLRAARLSTRLLLPLGVCTLPAFLLLGVAPMLLSVMTSVPLPL